MTERSPDFRSLRAKLPPEAFAWAEGPEHPPSDLIRPAVWASIVSLPDDVSLRTSDHFGTLVAFLWELWGEWIRVVGALQEADENPRSSPIAHTACDAVDYLEGSVYNALVGFYRLAFTSLRAVVEGMTVGLQLQLSSDKQAFSEWLAGREISFGMAADSCLSAPTITAFEEVLRQRIGDDFFHQRQRGIDDGGLARRLFGRLSSYAHGGPNFTDAAIWESNGPVFVAQAFRVWSCAFMEVFALGLLEARLAQPRLRRLGPGPTVTVEDLFRHVVKHIPDGGQGKRVLEAVPSSVW